MLQSAFFFPIRILVLLTKVGGRFLIALKVFRATGALMRLALLDPRHS